ncbi:MAG: ABC transporter substrate-binding protein [Erysipelothrix sp.]|jgi:putative ABC transport system substrate-binding protein|nr:ABC transporter substrate-binding protein [Erysipelothrix sp.]
MKQIIKALALITLSFTMLSACVSTSTPNEDEVFTIGVIQFVTHPALDATLEGLIDHLTSENLISRFNIIVQNAQGDPAVAATIAQQFVSDGVDLIYAIATPAAQAAFNATTDTNIPVVINAVTSPVGAGVVVSLESSETNVTGVTNAAPLEPQLALVKEMLPLAQNIGFLFNLGEVNGRVLVEEAQRIAPLLGMNAIVIGVSNISEVAAAMGQLLPQVDAVFNVTDNLVASATAQIVDLALQANKPVFGSDPNLLNLGLVAVDGVDFFALGQQAGVMVIDILLNDTLPTDIPIGKPTDTRLFINEEMAQALGITIPQSLLDRFGQ